MISPKTSRLDANLHFDKDEHIRFFKMSLNCLPSKYVSLDTGKMSAVRKLLSYFIMRKEFMIIVC